MCGADKSVTVFDDSHIHCFSNTTIEPTCKEKGYTLHKCQCGYEYKDSFVLATHKYKEAEKLEPSCEKDGYKVLSCVFCGDEIRNSTPALGHQWGREQISVLPTCNSDGTNIKKCKRCGTISTVSIPSLKHKREWYLDKGKRGNSQAKGKRRRSQQKDCCIFCIRLHRVIGVFYLVLVRG